MAFEVANAGVRNHSNQPTALGIAPSGSRFLPEIWSGKMLVKFYSATVFGEIANTDYEGEIKAHGDKIYIRTTPDITINTYVKGSNLTYENPTSNNVELLIDQGKYFAFNMFDIDKYQSDLNLMDDWSSDGAELMKISVDTDILGAIGPMAEAVNNRGAAAGKITQGIDLGTSVTPLALNKNNILDAIVDYGTVLDEQNIPESNRYLVMPPRMCGLIKKSELKDASLAGDGTSIFRNGRLGRLDRFVVYCSTNLSVDAGKYDVLFGHKSALSFAAQISDMEDLPNPSDFGRLVRSLMVYGYNVLKPDALGYSVATIN